jgi:hypothetical protein
MGRRLRQVHPWMSAERALAECKSRIGTEALAEAVEVFRLAFPSAATDQDEALHEHLDTDERATWAADILFVLERVHKVSISGGTAALLDLANGVSRARNADKFEASRKTWDESLRRARRRETWTGANLAGIPVASFYEMAASSRDLGRPFPRRPLTERQLRAMARWELILLRPVLDRMDARALRSLYRKLQTLRLKLIQPKGR